MESKHKPPAKSKLTGFRKSSALRQKIVSEMVRTNNYYLKIIIFIYSNDF